MARSRLALGLMSGTSADGLSVALVEMRGQSVQVKKYADFSYPKNFQKQLLQAGKSSVAELSQLDFSLGRLYARQARAFLKLHRIAPKRLTAVGSHGQTVVHAPGKSRAATLQIGEASFLSEALGVPVVCDFRPRDIAAGGEGAPLVPFFDQLVFGRGAPRIVQNIGGIGNAALVGRNIAPLAFDTGPGNCLIDIAVREMTRGKQRMDRNGRIAARGRVDEQRARRLLKDKYFSKKPPKSLDRATFSEKYLAKCFRGLRGADRVATVTYFTALSIADACRRHIPWTGVGEVVVSGGGALNPVLLGHLRRLLAPLVVNTTAQYGIAPTAKEAAAFAVMADYAVRGKSNNAAGATGASGPRILGKILPTLS
jgi:anhydro-N-acetylmuramic acid kinase